MRALRFHRELYRATAIDEAVAQLERFAAIERADEPPYFVVSIRVSDTDGRDDTARERAVAGTLANLALARTVEAGGPHR